MKLTRDQTAFVYSDFLTLEGIPSETFEYRLGNRPALEWVIDQYQVSTEKRSGITNDPRGKRHESQGKAMGYSGIEYRCRGRG